MVNNGAPSVVTARMVDMGIRQAAVEYSDKIVKSVESKIYHKDINPVIHLKYPTSPAKIERIKAKQHFRFEFRNNKVVIVTRIDAPPYRVIGSLKEVPRERAYELYLAVKRDQRAQAFADLRNVFAGNDLSEFKPGPICTGAIFISVPEHNWNYVSSLLSAFFEVAMK